MDECIESLAKQSRCKALKSIKVSGTEMDNKDVGNMTTYTNNDLYEYPKMPFRLENAPATLQLTMDVFFESVKRYHLPDDTGGISETRNKGVTTIARHMYGNKAEEMFFPIAIQPTILFIKSPLEGE